MNVADERNRVRDGKGRGGAASLALRGWGAEEQFGLRGRGGG